MKNNGWIGNYSYFRARINGSKEAVFDLDNNVHYSYNDLDDRANRLANYLKDKLYVVKGDRVAFISRNRIELIDAYYATAKLGAILIPYNARLSSNEFEKLINSETPKVLFYEDVFKDLVNEIQDRVNIEKYIVIEDTNKCYDDLTYDNVINYENNNMVFCSELDIEDIHLIIHTGGTTGLPKGGMISHRSEIFNSMNEICTWGINYEDSAHIILPLFHTGGWNLLTLPILHAGGRIIINKQFDPKLTLETVEKEKTTLLFGAATIFRMMSDLPEFKTADLSSLKWVMAGAAPTPINIMERFWEKGIKFVLGYGMTEAGPNNLSSTPQFMKDETIKKKYASVGKPMYLTMTKIVDEKGNQVGINEVGELLWSGPQIFSGYWGNEKETDKTLVDGWVYTGDMATVDEDGYYYIVGRKKNMYISGGENIFPPEIENALYEISEIHEVCVFGVPDEKWGEVGKAVISLKPDKIITREEIKSLLRNKLAGYKIPKYIQFLDDIPKNNVGKIVSSKIIELYGSSDE
ncbi:fatty-acyl-CoA synthase [Sedimentibacter acidaminivorans]|uniref:Fatty-acyl-CoA synthase n=1 Tax=Sedimentibacter acidaminivorans TaxID=913099 RepID=A0ABS4GA00_9FIRM|nr:AMP-binding protein [Sedimentibacter acidaminivorans]MBP1924511.1 fatty-acyl-CoA synthase [Sedimentibacter acidaminivorans]